MAMVLLLLAGVGAVAAQPRFSNIFQSHMVLQRDEPLALWGLQGSGSPGAVERLRVCLGDLCTHTECAPDGSWRASLAAQEGTSKPRTLWVIRERDGQGSLLDDIVVGDVYIFSGQSNIDIPEAYGHQVDPLRSDPSQNGAAAQAKEEALAEQLGSAGLLRMRIVDVWPDSAPRWNATEGQPELTETRDCPLCASPFALGNPDGTCNASLSSCNPMGNYSWCQCSAMAWARASATNVRGFSATSWFTAVALRASVAALEGVPVGVVKSSKGGSTIDLWSSADARQQCASAAPAPVPPCHAPSLCPGSLWAQMMAPFAGAKFKAIVWYQGENNLGQAFPYYRCALEAMVRDWRRKLQLPGIPFVVVQLQPWCTATKYCDDPLTAPLAAPPTALAEMRLAQAAAAAALPATALVTAVDLGSVHSQAGSCHSAQKPELGKRLALALKAAVYDNATVGASPEAQSVSRQGGSVVVQFSAPGGAGLALNASARCPAAILPAFCRPDLGFELCSAELACSAVPAASVRATGSRVVLPADASATRVRFLFADWPVVALRDAATGLPALPFDLSLPSTAAPLPPKPSSRAKKA